MTDTNFSYLSGIDAFFQRDKIEELIDTREINEFIKQLSSLQHELKDMKVPQDIKQFAFMQIERILVVLKNYEVLGNSKLNEILIISGAHLAQITRLNGQSDTKGFFKRIISTVVAVGAAVSAIAQGVDGADFLISKITSISNQITYDPDSGSGEN